MYIRRQFISHFANYLGISIPTMPSAKQEAQRKRFKKRIEEAKKIRKKNPELSWKECVKRAFAKAD
jgi:hypothetical protein